MLENLLASTSVYHSIGRYTYSADFKASFGKETEVKKYFKVLLKGIEVCEKLGEDKV